MSGTLHNSTYILHVTTSDAAIIISIYKKNSGRWSPLPIETVFYKNPEKEEIDASGLEFKTCLINEKAFQLGISWKWVGFSQKYLENSLMTSKL